MCLDCKAAVDLLKQDGYTDDAIRDFLWEHTAYPEGNNALPLVREFLATPRGQRHEWLRRDYEEFEREMERISKEPPDRA